MYTVKGERGGTLFVDPLLKAGAHVVTEGRALLKDGDRIEAKLEAPPPEDGHSGGGGRGATHLAAGVKL